MKIYLFVIDGRPMVRTDLARAQAALEDHLRDQRDVSDVWWDDDHPLWARKYLYGSSHVDTAVEDAEVDFETTDQLIWPVTLPDGEHQKGRARPFDGAGAELSLTVRTPEGRHQYLRAVPESEWSDSRVMPHIVLNFAVNAGQALADHLNQQKERTR